MLLNTPALVGVSPKKQERRRVPDVLAAVSFLRLTEFSQCACLWPFCLSFVPPAYWLSRSGGGPPPRSIYVLAFSDSACFAEFVGTFSLCEERLLLYCFLNFVCSIEGDSISRQIAAS